MNRLSGVPFSVKGVNCQQTLFNKIHEIVAGRDHISYDENLAIVSEIETLEDDLREYGLSSYYTLASDFVDGVCIKCGSAGIFRWHFLGKLKHPDCQVASYVSSGYYLKRQISAIFGSGIDAAKDFVKPDKKSGDSPGIIGKIFLGIWGFSFGFVMRLLGALIVLPIQLILYLAQGEKIERITVLDLKNDEQSDR